MFNRDSHISDLLLQYTVCNGLSQNNKTKKYDPVYTTFIYFFNFET